MVDQMRPHILGRQIKSISLLSGRYTKKDPEKFSIFAPLLHSSSVVIRQVSCKGKFIYFEIENNESNSWSIWNTLGMTGGWSNTKFSDSRVMLEFDEFDLFFNDSRNFGTIKFCDNPAELAKKLSSLGMDPLAKDIPDTYVTSRLRNFGRKTMAEVLMNQAFLAGVGNYIKAEALYLSRISPHRMAGSLTQAESELLNKSIMSIIRSSYDSGGSTIKSYKDFNGNSGNFSSRFLVYGNKKDPLGNDVIREETKDKRTTHWVPSVQK